MYCNYAALNSKPFWNSLLDILSESQTPWKSLVVENGDLLKNGFNF